jgi:predicted methyltransferase
MRALAWFLFAAVATEVACTQTAEPPPVVPAPTAAPASTAASAPPVAPAPPAPAVVPPATELGPEDRQHAKEQSELAADWAKLDAADRAETARLTPEIHAATKALVEKNYPNVDVALTAVLASKHRKPGDPERDVFRHPRETLELFGLKQNQTVLEYGPGEGWYTELLAPLLEKKGKLVITTSDANGSKNERSTLNGERMRRFLAGLPEAYGKVQSIIVDSKAPNLGPDASMDLVVFCRGAHGLTNSGSLATYLAEFHRVLKPNGVLGIEQHRAAANADPLASSKNGYLPEAWLTAQVEAAGFRLAGKSEVNANPKDTKDYPEGVWTLPPTLRLGEKDRDKYLAIGESDRMTLKFVKVAAAKHDADKKARTPKGGGGETP